MDITHTQSPMTTVALHSNFSILDPPTQNMKLKRCISCFQDWREGVVWEWSHNVPSRMTQLSNLVCSESVVEMSLETMPALYLSRWLQTMREQTEFVLAFVGSSMIRDHRQGFHWPKQPRSSISLVYRVFPFLCRWHSKIEVDNFPFLNVSKRSGRGKSQSLREMHGQFVSNSRTFAHKECSTS
jgi:hypothetical protein